MDDPLADAAETLRRHHRLAVDVEDRTITVVDAVNGDPGHAVLRVLGVAEGASPVGAAAYGATGVAAGVWADPELFLARWTRGQRWVVGYRLGGGSKPNHYVRTEGRIPTRLETGSWYANVPDDVRARFSEAGLSLDERPFAGVDVPAADAPPAPRSRAEPSRLCPSCCMHKAPGQFTAGSELCVDCRA